MTVEGITVWEAAVACRTVTPGGNVTAISVDLNAALSIAQAEGCAPAIAAALLRDVARGLITVKPLR